ncbi:MAG: hypothetical protein GY854_12495 [Deltaproteobacteria bacterium]|nr:hypothetical protein [Deltaproteobacteria bacterium]
MAHDTTLHVKLDPTMAEDLKQLASNRNKSKGQLVREALVACYQTGLLGLTRKQEQAVHAFQGGFISMGKLAEVMGMHALELRTWLKDHKISQNTSYGENDSANA